MLTVPLLICRLSSIESSMVAVTAAAAGCSSAVQQSQLSAALAQLSAAAVRQQQELKAVLSGLAHRVELLEAEAARQDSVVMQVMFEVTVSSTTPQRLHNKALQQ